MVLIMDNQLRTTGNDI